MTLFLTSSPCVIGEAALNPANGFLDSLLEALPGETSCLYFASDPDDHVRTDYYAGEMRAIFERGGVRFSDYTVCDGRNGADVATLLAGRNLLILAGGHVPTQNRFFRDIGLRDLLRAYDGVVVGISAGSMNAAEVVYAQPEMEGESIDPDYERFLPGLGLTRAMLLPHYQEVCEYMLDGRRLYEDITFEDSMGHIFYVMPDGTYLYGDRSRQELCGEAYRICNGEIELIAQDGDIYAI